MNHTFPYSHHRANGSRVIYHSIYQRIVITDYLSIIRYYNMRIKLIYRHISYQTKTKYDDNSWSLDDGLYMMRNIKKRIIFT